MNTPPLFSERQRFTQWWLWLLLLGVNGLLLFGVFKQVFYGQVFGDRPMSDGGLILVTMLVLLVTAGIFSHRLDTEIRQDGIYVRFAPYRRQFKYYPWEQIDQAYVRRYNPIGEYGGWGWRWAGSGGVALNISGNQGLQLVLNNGKKLLVGTNKPEALQAALQSLGRSARTPG